MIVFRELFLDAEPGNILKMVDAVEQSLNEGWRRDFDAERRLKERSIGDDAIYCFACEADGRRAAARLFLKQQGVGTFLVTNIIPSQSGQLSHAQYNAILEEFHDDFVVPAAKRFGVRVRMTADQQGLDAWLSQEAIERLEAFSTLANRTTGSTQSHDRDRWFSFLLKTHEEESRLDPAMLTHWLESQFWDPDIARDLAVEYQRGRDLLAFADAHRPVQSV